MIHLDELTTGGSVRLACRNESLVGSTVGLAPGCVQAGLVVLPAEYANAFHEFCLSNSQVCPLLEVTQPGDAVPRHSADDADLRTDLPAYCVWRQGALLSEVRNVRRFWQADSVGFLIGATCTPETILRQTHRDVAIDPNAPRAPVYTTELECVPAGPFAAQIRVVMRTIPSSQRDSLLAAVARCAETSGRPLHIGDPNVIGIRNLLLSSSGDGVVPSDDETPVFWPSLDTIRSAIEFSGVPTAIIHRPDCLFVTDLREP